MSWGLEQIEVGAPGKTADISQFSLAGLQKKPHNFQEKKKNKNLHINHISIKLTALNIVIKEPKQPIFVTRLLIYETQQRLV